MFVGRLTKDAEIKEFSDGKRVINICLAVSRGYKNPKGEIETDYFYIAFWDFLVDYVIDNLKTGMAVAVKGRIQTSPKELSNGYVLQAPILIGERLMFFNQPENVNQEEKNEE